MKRRLLAVSTLLFCSGLTALVYQVAWMRELRLIFGFSTAASAAVVAIFLAGLGVGGWLLGPRADAAPRPLAFYGWLELAIAAAAAITPLLVLLVRLAYIALGGTQGLGLFGGTLARLLFSAAVLAVPTVLMGGTLPAAARAVATDEDAPRRSLAVLYGANTLGALVGTFLSTFLLLELFGTRSTLWLACALNALVGLSAVRLSRDRAEGESQEAPKPKKDKRRRKEAESPLPRIATDSGGRPAAPATFVLAAAATVGFAFMLMELVWYRMLSPLLGGSTYTFGLILAVALLGIGVGSAVYSRAGGGSATLAGFAATCAVEALFLALPWALGDRIALFAILVRPFGAFGFAGYVAGWS
ncbi:MAG TPA: fused MFS/spermidine synthase, partial [Thermoanaerobaculia bacterium]|nr:fused MFS/spermidine synthase [Thermoanaerobaculia bacterium]